MNGSNLDFHIRIGDIEASSLALSCTAQCLLQPNESMDAHALALLQTIQLERLQNSNELVHVRHHLLIAQLTFVKAEEQNKDRPRVPLQDALLNDLVSRLADLYRGEDRAKRLFDQETEIRGSMGMRKHLLSAVHQAGIPLHLRKPLNGVPRSLENPSPCTSRCLLSAPPPGADDPYDEVLEVLIGYQILRVENVTSLTQVLHHLAMCQAALVALVERDGYDKKEGLYELLLENLTRNLKGIMALEAVAKELWISEIELRSEAGMREHIESEEHQAGLPMHLRSNPWLAWSEN